MVNVRFNADGPNPPESGSGGGVRSEAGDRLNLLLSYAGWQQESWVDRVPLMLEPLGVRSLHAGTGREASRLIDQNPIHIAVVDLGLPFDEVPESAGATEAGPRLLEMLGRLEQPPPTVVVKRRRSQREDCREINAALRAGAFAVIDRPYTQSDLEGLLEVLRRCLGRYYQGRWPGGAV